MDYRKQLTRLIEQKNGLILTKDAEAVGVPRHYLSLFVKEHLLDRVRHGVYLSPDAFDDEMYVLQARSNKLIFSHETALYLHDLTDRDPLEYVVTVPAGYNASNVRKAGVKVYTVKEELYSLGTTEGKTEYGRPVTIYNKERTICDIIRSRNSMDIAILNDAIKRYVTSRDKNIPLLLRYAQKFRVQTILRNYLEILL
ncbi:abortive phage infection protein [Domibacillus aminovorans]|uniref:Abortive phage infection protein n=1 Tax=Domibacillus aminovorans TaxID=29332 RepID=A0A177KUB3_9BACI|nr:type IV toxin-antitoxin system AbiEi family antitoxin domain-containing protein [Domibacillus aminovorans]OAH56959.1 abortive phage infection protein [Domibacillus aminovorans]